MAHASAAEVLDRKRKRANRRREQHAQAKLALPALDTPQAYALSVLRTACDATFREITAALSWLTPREIAEFSLDGLSVYHAGSLDASLSRWQWMCPAYGETPAPRALLDKYDAVSKLRDRLVRPMFFHPTIQ